MQDKDNENIQDRVLRVEKDRVDLSSFKIIKWVIFCGVTLVGIVQIYGYLTDKSIRRYACPANLPVLDAPIRLSRIEKVPTKKEFQNLILGFVRRFIRAQHPHNNYEVETLYKYAADHSIGWVQKDYLARMNNIKQVKSEIEKRNYTSLYPKSHFDFKVRKDSSDDNVWIVQFPALEVRRRGNREFGRTYVNATYHIYFNTPGLDSAESGPVVKHYELIETVDDVTKEKRNIRD